MKTEKNYSSLTKDNSQFTHPLPLTFHKTILNRFVRQSPNRGWGKISSVDIKNRKIAFTLAECTTHVAPSKVCRRGGFTLAEVLITLAVIGVVAALTIPSMVSNYKKKVVVNKLKRNYTFLVQALDRARIEHGDPAGWQYYEKDNLELWVNTYIAPYLKGTVENCSTVGKKTITCSFDIHPIGSIKKHNAANGIWHGIGTSNLDLGLKYRFVRYDNIRTQIYVYLDVKKYSDSKYLPVAKTVSYLGKDVFMYVYDHNTKNPTIKPFTDTTKNRVIFDRTKLLDKDAMRAGACDKDAYGGPDYISGGSACSAIIMMDGWQIKNDYPVKF